MVVFLHHSHTEVPTSTKVKEDLLTSGLKLDKIKTELRKYESSTEKKIEVIQEIEEGLKHIINVYNANVDKIQTGCNLIKSFEYPTFDQWLENNPIFYNHWPEIKSKFAHVASEIFRPKYDNGRAGAENHYLTNLDNNYNLAQSTTFQLRLKQKIEKVIQRASAQNLPVEQLPKLKELAEYDAKMKDRVEAILRQLKDKLTTIRSPSTELPRFS